MENEPVDASNNIITDLSNNIINDINNYDINYYGGGFDFNFDNLCFIIAPIDDSGNMLKKKR